MSPRCDNGNKANATVALTTGGIECTPLCKSEVSKLLPVIQNSEYYTMPDLDGLSNMLRGDAHALPRVHGFVIGRKGYGEIKFLEPVNIEGLSICDTVSITRGKILSRFC